MRVGFLTVEFPRFSETFVINQVVGLLEAGHDVRIFSTFRPGDPPDHAVVDEYDLLDRTTYLFDEQSKLRVAARLGRALAESPLRMPNALLDLATEREHGGLRYVHERFYEEHVSPAEFDVFHAHFGLRGVEWDFVAADAPLVVSFYGHDASTVLIERPDLYTKHCDDWDAITVLSEYMGSKLVDHGIPASKITKMPLVIDTERFVPHERSPSEGPHELLSVGRFVEKKGFKYAIQALGELGDGHDYRYRIAGGGPLEADLRATAERAGVTEKVQFLGRVPQQRLIDLYRNADLLVAPSVTSIRGDEEGTPTVLLEAQASATPVVSTYHAGIPEIVEAGETGFLVPERSIEALHDALSTALTLPKRELEEMGAAGREKVAGTHGIPAGADRLTRLYRSLR